MGSAVNWISREQSSVATSTTHAELFAAVDGIKSILTIRILVWELQHMKHYSDYDLLATTQVWIDNEATVKTMNAEDFLQGTNKHMAVRYFWIRELLDRVEIRIQYVRSAENLADICTKIQGPQSMTNACQLLYMRFN